MMLRIADDVVLRSATNADRDTVKQLVLGVLAEYGLQPDLDGTDADLNDLEANYLDRGGVFEVVENGDGQLLGSIGLYPLDHETIELRKMYFDPALRGRGLGRKLLDRMITIAKEKGYRRVFLETASKLKQAVHLYESGGFRPVHDTHTPRCDQAYVLDLDDEGT